MSKEKRFLRKCIGCGAYRIKAELIKITTEHKTGEIYVNSQRGIYGRSCYICKDKDCINKAFQRKKITKIIKRNINTDIKEKIITVLEK